MNNQYFGKKLLAWDENTGSFSWVSPRISARTVFDDDGKPLNEFLEVSAAEAVDIIENLIKGAPEEYDTLKEIGEALQNNKDSITTILNEINKKIPIPKDGDVGQVLKMNSNGQIVFGNDNDTIYTHPATHSVDIIETNQDRMFMTLQEKNYWNNKLNVNDVLSQAMIKLENGENTLLESIINLNNNRIKEIEDSVGVNIATLDSFGLVPKTQLPDEIFEKVEIGHLATINYVDTKNTVSVVDSRDEQYTPQWYMSNNRQKMVFEFKRRSAIGNPPINATASNSYTLMLTMIPWGDSSGGYPTQITFGNSIGLRRGISNDEWGNWIEFASTDDIPTKLSELESDLNNRLVTDTEKNTWNNKQNALGFTPENVSKKGSANGYAGLDNNGKVPASQLPSFVDDVIEITSLSGQGEAGKIYVLTTNNKTYRWSGSGYVEISESLALGETSSTAFPGDRGKVLENQVAQKTTIVTVATHQEYENMVKQPNTLYLVGVR